MLAETDWILYMKFLQKYKEHTSGQICNLSTYFSVMLFVLEVQYAGQKQQQLCTVFMSITMMYFFDDSTVKDRQSVLFRQTLLLKIDNQYCSS